MPRRARGALAAPLLGALLCVGLLLPGPMPGFPALGTTGTTFPTPSPGAASSSAAPRTVAPAFVPPPGTVDLGPLAPTSNLSLVVGLPSANPSGLAGFLASAYLAGSPSYHHFLSPHAFADRFGPSTAALGAAATYFASFGLSVSDPGRSLLLEVRGPAPSVARAFGTTFEEYREPTGRVVFSHPTAAVLPVAIALTGVYGLGNVSPLRPVALEPGVRTALAAPAATCGPGPAGLAPCQVANAYSFTPLFAAGTNGSGARIGVVDAYDAAESQTQLASDFASFAGEFGLPGGGVSYAYPVPTSLNLNRSGANAGWGLEEALDLEWARAAAPGADLEMTFSPDAGAGLFTAVDWLVRTDAVNAISMSWGEPFTGVFNAYAGPCSSACNASSDGTFAVLDPILTAAAAEGISVFAATGDCGAADGTSGLAVNYPAADPYVTAVGGTVLSVAANGTYLSEAGWNGNASGASAPGCQNQGGSGGGYAPIPRPWWQAALPASPSGRAVPDVALDAGTPVTIVEGGADQGVLGTSLATPVWAGIAALAVNRSGGPVGLLNPSLYALYHSTYYPELFHDVQLGNNGYSAGPGWDAVTGLGSPIVSALLPNLTAAPPVGPGPTSLLYAAPRFGPAPLTVAFALTVSGGTGTYPLEGVDFGDGNSSLAGGEPTHTYRTPGVYAAVGLAVDSGGNTSASPPIAIVVGGGNALSVRLNASTVAPAAGAAVSFTVALAGGAPPYSYALWFGDGTSVSGSSSLTVTHTYRSVGGFCAEAVAEDAATPPDGAASPRIGISVGGAPAPACGNDSTPLTLTPSPAAPVRDAPADFPALFASSGGATAPPGLSNSVQYRSSDPYASACQCAIFRVPGNYSVDVWENDTVDQNAFAETNVTVAPPLVGAFRASSLEGTVPLTVAFSAAVEGGYRANASATEWTFGNGQSAVGATASVTYTLPGEYLAEGHLSDGGHGNTSEAFLIDARAPGATGYGVRATVTPAVDLPSGTTVAFDGAIVDPAGTPGTSLAWDLGNGTGAFGSAVNETYFGLPPGANDQLSVRLSVLLPNTVPLVSTAVTLPSFVAVEPGGFVPRTSTLTLSGNLTPTVGRVPLPVHGTARSAGTGPTVLAWQFGDGANAVGGTVSHTFATAGLYTVRVLANDTYGDGGVLPLAVVANPPLTVEGGPSLRSGPAPLTVTFSVLGVGGAGPPYNYSWDFGPGPPANGSTVSHTFADAGTYAVRVLVTDRSGASAERNWTIEVEVANPLPLALLFFAGATGTAVGLLAYWLPRRARSAAAGPPTP